MLFSNCRATNLVPMLLAMCCWAATTLAANANEQSFKSLCGLGALDVPGFTSAQPAFVPPPSYPSEAENNWSEGWAMLEYAISSDGAVRGITVVDALGPSDFIASTVKAVESWRYKPATSTRNHKSLRRRPLTRRWWTFDLVHTNGSAVLL